MGLSQATGRGSCPSADKCCLCPLACLPCRRRKAHIRGPGHAAKWLPVRPGLGRATKWPAARLAPARAAKWLVAGPGPPEYIS